MDLGSLIETHGYWVLVIGCLLEGETILLLAGFAAHRGYLDPWAVVVIAAVAGFLGDQFFFWLGRRHGKLVLARWPTVMAHNDRLQRLIARYHTAVIIGVRFTYGLRIAGPVLIGMSAVSRGRFALLNAVGAVLWACLIAGIGWSFGKAAEMLMTRIQNAQIWLLLGLAALALLVWLVQHRRRE